MAHIHYMKGEFLAITPPTPSVNNHGVQHESSGSTNECCKINSEWAVPTGNICRADSGPATSSGYQQPPATVKKLVIKNFAKPELPVNFVEDTWKKIKDAVSSIQDSQPISVPQEELYSAVVNLCSNKKASYLYTNLMNLIETHLVENSNKFLKDFANGILFLKTLNEFWERYNHQMSFIRNIFLYLDRKYTLRTEGVIPIWDLGINMFHIHVMRNGVVQNQTFDGLLHLIELERRGKSIDKGLFKNIICMLSELEIYEVFEKKFLEATDQFYEAEGQLKMQYLEVPDYLIYAQTRINQEWNRSLQYLNPLTQKQLMHYVEKQLIHKSINSILQKGFESLLDENNVKGLVCLYTLFSRVEEGLPQLCSHFTKYAEKLGLQIVTGTEKSQTMIQNLLKLKKKLDNLVNSCFQKNIKLCDALDTAFRTVINSQTNKLSQLIAKCFDSMLRTANKEIMDDELNGLFNRLIALFKYFYDKDVFKAFYKKDLSKRLLLGKSASADIESVILSKLVKECGPDYTKDLEIMLNDMEISKTMMFKFNQHLQSVKLIPLLDIYFNAVTSEVWPSSHPMKINLPKYMAQYQNMFETFYVKQHSERKLLWQPDLDHCVIIANFPAGTKELQVSSFQATVLLLFNEKDSCSFDEIKKSTGIEPGLLRQTLKSLSCVRLQILCKLPQGTDIATEDIFYYNAEFKSMFFRLQLNNNEITEMEKEASATEVKVFQNREVQIDGIIVRIMKTERSMLHKLLISEITKQLKFPSKPITLKPRIESLIDRHFIERDINRPDMYHYID